MSRYTSTSNTWISQNIPEYQNARYWGQNENILVGFLSIHTEIYVSWIIQHQNWNKLNNSPKF